MCRVFNEIKRDCYKKGYKEGLRLGKELVTIATTMLKEGMSIDLISRCTGLSIDEINSLKITKLT